MDSLQYDFSRICRACRNESVDMRSVFEDYGKSGQKTRVDEMLMACASVQIDSEDDLPKLICTLCIHKLESAYLFKKQCESVDGALREVLKTIKAPSVKEELSISQTEQDILNDIFNSSVPDNDFEPPEETKKPKNNFTSSDENMAPEVVMQDQTVKSDYIDFLENNQLMLTCRLCLKMFTTLDGLKCHKRVHTGDLFKCKTCDKEYIRLNHLQRHELSHGRKKVHVCKICNKTLSRIEHLKRHLITHLKEKPFICNICNRGFSRTEPLLNHIKRCKGDRVHICDICNKAFNREDSLELHKRLHENKMPVLPTLENLDNISEHYFEIDCDDSTFPSYPDEFSDDDGDDNDNFPTNATEEFALAAVEETQDEQKDETNAEQEQQSEEKTKIEEESGECKEESMEQSIDTESNDINNDLENLGYEDVVEKGYEDDVLGNDSDSNHSEYLPEKPVVLKIKRGRGRPRKNPSAAPPVKVKSSGKRGRLKAKKETDEDDVEEEEGEYPCAQCNQVFKKASRLEKHKDKCPGTNVFKCEVCSKEFARSNHLKRHMSSHSEKKPFVCDKCNKRFNRRDHLTQHMKLHNRSKEHECEICQRPFARADHLAKHKLIKHNVGEKIIGEKKYPCNICLKSFTTEKYRDVHMKGHTGEKKFKCRTCDKAFISKSHLTEHMKFHNDNSKKFLCSECGQRFIRNDYLVIHMRRHRGEKPFKCKYCGKGFPRTTDLTVHERYHTGEKTHLCTICGRGFGRAYNLTVHMRTHTGEKPYQCTYCDAAFAQGNDLKAHIRRHTGERFHCDLCPETFLMGYLLTQHKRTVHGLNIVSNIRRLQPIQKLQQTNPDEPPPITIPLPQPVVPTTILNSQLQAHITAVQIHQLQRE